MVEASLREQPERYLESISYRDVGGQSVYVGLFDSGSGSVYRAKVVEVIKPNQSGAESTVDPARAVYVGDSLVRDVYMAQRAGVHSAWAKFGTLYNKGLWPQLVRVTHWTEADVERENNLREQARGTEPECVLNRFCDLLDNYAFEPPIRDRVFAATPR